MKEEQDRTPLRTILQNFINHIESLEIQNVEDRYEKEFQELKFFSEILKTSKQYSCSEGEKEVNRKKNRYKDILPFDSSRVILSEYAGVPGSDYINANYIKGASGSPAYIACQGPLPHTVNDFWRMVVECEVQVIVMACNEEEAGKTVRNYHYSLHNNPEERSSYNSEFLVIADFFFHLQHVSYLPTDLRGSLCRYTYFHKCENYWVDREGEEKQFGMVAIRLVKASTVCPDFLVRTMRLKYVSSQLPHVSEERTVCQFHYSTWPDHGVPRLVRPLLDMVRLVRDTQASETLPVLVHCSAGCGRTGTICAIDYVWGLLRAGKLSRHFSLHKLVQDMRKQRIAMVQTKEQYILVHQAVRELFREQLRMIDSHPYENIDANGMPLVKEEQEPVYASPTIIVLAENNSEEKQDGKEKELEEQIPPLPQKKKSSIASSKQEKEVENLTEKQRSIVEQSGVGMLHKPRIAKLKALFERSPTTRESRSVQTKQQKCQLVTRSHSIGAVRVRAENQEEQVVVIAERCREGNVNDPIVSNASLHVSQRSTVQGSSPVRPTVPIKRSKSLKVLGSNQHYKLTLATAINSVTPYSTTDDVSSVPSATSVKPSDNMLSRRDEGASNLKPVKKYLTRSKGVNISEPDIDSRRFSQRGNGHCVSQTHLNQMTYEGNSMVPRRRRSLESVNFEDMTVPGGTSLDCCKFVLQSSPQLQSTNVDAKLLQDSSDYTVGKIKHHVLCDHPENKLQNSEAADTLTLEAQRKVNAIVAGLGIRERRNSFRQAVGTGQEGEVKSSRKLRDYETIWPSGNVSSPSGSVKSRESSSSGSYVNVISGNSCTAGSDLKHSHIQTRKGKFGNWQETQNSQNPRDDRLQQPDELKWPSVSCGLVNNRVSEVKGLPVEGLKSKHGMNVYVTAEKSDVRLERSSVQPKNLLRSKVLIPERTEMHHSQAGMDPKLSADECPGRFSLSVDASNNFQSLPQCELTGQRPKSAAVWQRKSKNHINSKSVEFKSHSKQENSLQTTVGQELRTGPWVGMTAVTGNISAKKVSYNCNPSSVSHHRNATGLVVSHGPSPGVGNAVQGQCKSGPAVCDTISRPAEAMAAPFTQPKKQYTKQPVSYGLVAGIQLHRGSRDDLALCPSPSGAVGRSGPNAQSRVRRHASVVLLRRSLAEAGRVGPVNSSLSQPSLAVWNSTKSGSGEVLSKQNTHFCDQEGPVASGSGSWLQAPGVDVDTVAASISLYHGGSMIQSRSSGQWYACPVV